MGGKAEDEDYWNSCDSKAFSFDEGEFNSEGLLFNSGRNSSRSNAHKTSIADTIFEGIPTISPQTAQRPLGSLISKHSLTCILEEEKPKPKVAVSVEEELRMLKRQCEEEWVPRDVEKTVRLMMVGQPYSLHLYRSLELKTKLLDEAIASGDGNAILAVMLHLSRTLKKSLFHQLLQSRPVAVSHYLQHLNTRLQVHEVIDLLEMLGLGQEAAMRQLHFAVSGAGASIERRVQRLKLCYGNHFTGPDTRDKQLVLNFVTYLEWLRAAGLPYQPVLASLAETCRTHWSDAKGSATSPLTLHTLVEVSERQFQWTVLRSRATLQAWHDLETLFITKGWLGGKKLNSVIHMDKIATELHKHKAPSQVLTQYLVLIDNLDRRLELARRLQCHRVTVDVLVAMKDRQGLVEFKANLNPQSEDYLHAENMLRSSVKWKN